jgi:hypothetical protein
MRNRRQWEPTVEMVLHSGVEVRVAQYAVRVFIACTKYAVFVR